MRWRRCSVRSKTRTEVVLPFCPSVVFISSWMIFVGIFHWNHLHFHSCRSHFHSAFSLSHISPFSCICPCFEYGSVYPTKRINSQPNKVEIIIVYILYIDYSLFFVDGIDVVCSLRVYVELIVVPYYIAKLFPCTLQNYYQVFFRLHIRQGDDSDCRALIIIGRCTNPASLGPALIISSASCNIAEFESCFEPFHAAI